MCARLFHFTQSTVCLLSYIPLHYRWNCSFGDYCVTDFNMVIERNVWLKYFFWCVLFVSITSRNVVIACSHCMCCINWSSKQQVRQHLSLAYHREEICVRGCDFKCILLLVSLWSFLASVTRPDSCCCFEKMCFWQQQGEPETDSPLLDYNKVACWWSMTNGWSDRIAVQFHACT